MGTVIWEKAARLKMDLFVALKSLNKAEPEF
jgi:hypothetical protein